MANEIICLGDSITGWKNHSHDISQWPFKTYPEFLEEIVKNKSKIHQFKVINYGYDGELAKNASIRLAESLSLYSNARFFVLLFGTNDLYQSSPLRIGETSERVRGYMIQAAKRIKNEGKIPIMLTIPHIFPELENQRHNKNINLYNQSLSDNCKQNEVTLINISSRLRSQHFADGVHPNEAGARIIAEEVYRELKKRL